MPQQSRKSVGPAVLIARFRNAWRSLRVLLHHHDAKAVALARAIDFDQTPLAKRREIAHRMIELLADNDWMLREETETFG